VIVVSDASPLNYLVLTGYEFVLPLLFGMVHVPDEVVREIRDPRAPEPVRVWIGSPPPWLQISTPTGPFTTEPKIHAGEAHAVALAKELGAKALLIDERLGREFAKREGLTVVGTLTVLELAAERKMIELPAAIEKLQRTNFRIGKLHLHEALSRDAARKPR
jgi:predicted nucleic acid-binding protein